MLSVLQIADLHRSPADPVTNDQLIATIVREHDLAVTAGMPQVKAIVVCGDLVQGCVLGIPNFERELAVQYHVAQDFLTQLVRKLLDGDMSRLVVVPGNHDVCWNTVRPAMVEASTAEQEEAFKLLQQHGTPFRWDWATRKLFRIGNAARYNARLDAYHTFLSTLYGSALPKVINGDAWLFPIDDILFVGFESCVGTDCFSHMAAINADTIAQVATTLRERSARLHVAVWHHNIEGPPATSDYLDQSCIRQLVYYGFRLGLHGHQHYATTAPVYIYTDREEHMAVISAGSLCAGRRELPPGRNRGFNLVVIDEERNKAHVRSLAMDMEARVQPEYVFNGGSAEREVSWTPAITVACDVRKITLDAERAKNENRSAAAIAMLVPHFDQLGVYGRSLLLELLLTQGKLDEVLYFFEEQLAPAEVPNVVSSLIDVKKTTEASRVLDRYQGEMMPSAVTYFRQKISMLKKG